MDITTTLLFQSKTLVVGAKYRALAGDPAIETVLPDAINFARASFTGHADLLVRGVGDDVSERFAEIVVSLITSLSTEPDEFRVTFQKVYNDVGTGLHTVLVTIKVKN